MALKASKRGNVPPFIVMDVMDAAAAAEAAGRNIIHMEVGQPGTPAPSGARAKLIDAMQKGPLGYTVALGIPALRERIARHYGDRHDIDLDPSRVIVTSGSSAGFLLAFTALFDAGEPSAIPWTSNPSLLSPEKSSCTPRYAGRRRGVLICIKYSRRDFFDPGRPRPPHSSPISSSTVSAVMADA